jgi:transposase InsO family protein
MTLDPHQQAVAIARFAIIAPLVTRPLDPPAYAEAAKAVVAARHAYPGHPEGRHVSERSLRRWVAAYKAALPDGTVAALAALAPTGRSDKGKPRVFEPAAIEEAIRLRQELPTRSTAVLVAHLGHRTLKTATLAYHLRRRGASKKALAKAGRAFPRYEAPAVNATWQSDVKDGLWLPDPLDPAKKKEVHLMGFLDDHSRLVAHGEWYFKESLPCLFDCFKKAILKHGVPAKVYWDNGPIYRAKQTRLVAARLGTKVIFSTEYHSEGRGKVERFWQTVAGGFITEARHADIRTLAELNAAFWAWLDTYNHRVHGTTHQAPLERWEAGKAAVRWAAPQDLAEAFLWEDTRLVKKTGTFSLSGNEYRVDDALVGKTVTLRFDPLDLASVRVYEGGVFREIAAPATLLAHTHKKATPKRTDAKYLPLPSSKRLLAARTARHAIQIASDLADVALAAPAHPTPAAWQGLLEELLDRQLVAAEVTMAVGYFERFTPPPELARQVLSARIARHGTDRHLSFYLEELRLAVAGGRA